MFKLPFATALLLLATLAPCVALAAETPKPERLLSQSFVKPLKDRPKPLLSFQDGDNQRFTLKSFKGRYVILNVWATWCSPCVKEMPALDALQDHVSSRNVAVIALSEDRQGASVVSGFYQRHELKNLKVYIDTDGTALSLLNLRGLPTTLVLGPDGQEIGRIEDSVNWMNTENLAFIDQLTGAKSP